MKKMFFICLLFISILQVSAQEWGHAMYGNRFSGKEYDGYLSKGYRGMVETCHGCGFYNPSYVLKFTTTHGYQFNPYLYLGGFISLGTIEYYTRTGADNGFNFRTGSDFRVYPCKGRFTPFVGTQIGLDIGPSMSSICLNGNLGLRIAINKKMGVNIAAVMGIWTAGTGLEALMRVGFEF